MKLLLKQIWDNGPIAVCDEAGVALPNQMSVVIASRPDDIVTATVVFAVGDDVRLVGIQPEDAGAVIGKKQ